MPGFFAEFEINLCRESHAKGNVAAKRRCTYCGRPQMIHTEPARNRLMECQSPTRIGCKLGVSHETLFKAESKTVGKHDDANPVP